MFCAIFTPDFFFISVLYDSYLTQAVTFAKILAVSIFHGSLLLLLPPPRRICMLFISGLAESILQIKYGVEGGKEAARLHMKLVAISGCGLDWMFRFWCYLNNNPCRPRSQCLHRMLV